MHARNPALRGKPVLPIGESMGAITRIGMTATGAFPYDTALFVAGRGDLIEITRGSALRGVLDHAGLVDDPEFARPFRGTCT